MRPVRRPAASPLSISDVERRHVFPWTPVSAVPSRDHGSCHACAVAAPGSITLGTSRRAAHCALRGGGARTHPKQFDVPPSAVPSLCPGNTVATGGRKQKRPGSLRYSGLVRERRVRAYAPPPPGCLAREYPLPSHGWLKALVLSRRGTENRKPINPLPARTNRTNDRKLRCVRASRVAVTMFPWGDEVECEDRPRRRIASGWTVNSLYSLVNTRHNLFSVACCFFRVRHHYDSPPERACPAPPLYGASHCRRASRQGTGQTVCPEAGDIAQHVVADQEHEARQRCTGTANRAPL